MCRAALIIALFLVNFISLSANEFTSFPIATDSTLQECEPYVTYYWHSGWENNIYLEPKNHIWLVYVTRNINNGIQQIIASNLGQDSI